VVAQDVPEIDVKLAVAAAGAPVAGTPAQTPTPATPAPATAPRRPSKGCGCSSDGRDGAGNLALVLSAALVFGYGSRRRRRRPPPSVRS